MLRVGLLTCAAVGFGLTWRGPGAAMASTGLAEPEAGAVYWVSPDGDDGNPGTEGRPWRTVQKAAETLKAGETALIRQGVYAEHVVVANSGTEDGPITFQACPGEKPALDATGLERSWGIFEMHGKSHVRIVGLELCNADRGQGGVVARGCSHIQIRNCRTFNTGASGILVWECDHVIIDGNEVERACQRGGEESVTVKFSSDTVQVSNNHIHHTGHEGIDVKEGSRNVRVFNNHIHHAERQGLYADAWDRETCNIEFFNNVVHDCGFGIAVCSEQGGRLHGIRIYNNLIYSNAGPGMIFSHWTRAEVCPVDDVWFVNNTVHNNGHGWGGGVVLENDDARAIVVRNNILSGNSVQILVNQEPAEATIDHNLIHGTSGAAGDDCVAADPLFANPEEGDFHLREGSPAIDRGSGDGAPEFDLEGDPRPCGQGVDIGAYEHCAEARPSESGSQASAAVR